MKALYRVFAALAVLLVFPALYFMKFIRIVVELGFMDGFFEDTFSINDIVKGLQEFQISANEFEFTQTVVQTLQPLKNPAITTAVFFCVMLVMVLAVLVCSAFTNAKKVNLVFAALGVVATIGTIASFNALTDVVISGTVPLGNIVNAFMADSESAIAGIASMLGLGSMVNVVGELRILQLGSAFNAVLFIFIFEVIWAVSFIVINMDSEKPAKVKHAKNRK